MIDFCGPFEQRPYRTWFVTFSRTFGAAGAVAALLSGDVPVIEIMEGSDASVVASARPGSEAGSSTRLLSALADCLQKAAILVSAALEGIRPQVLQCAPERRFVGPLTIGTYAVTRLVRGLERYVYSSLYYAPHWEVRWRYTDGPDLTDSLDLSESTWHRLPDDGYHFYADPFPITIKDRTFLFVEDFDHRLGRGVISVVEFGNSGPIGLACPVLSSNIHLSYPFVFEDEGMIWMVPESSGARTIDLYRAISFPDHWEREATLVSGIEASDATLVQVGDCWWMMATVRNGGSCSDTLFLWSAVSLHGPWIPHRKNPVLIDIAAARPAGRVVYRDGRLIRPVQDCRRGYGASIALAEITRLDADWYDQLVIGILRTAERWPQRRIHTLNRAGRLEFVDGFAMSLKLKAKMTELCTWIPKGRSRPRRSANSTGRLRRLTW